MKFYCKWNVSIPVITTESDALDDLRRFLTEPPATLPTAKKIKKRRNTVGTSSPDSDREIPEFPLKKVERIVPSTVVAKARGRPKSIMKHKDPRPVPTAGPSKPDGKLIKLISGESLSK